MKVCIKSYGGLIGWGVHKYLSRYLIGPWFCIQQLVRMRKTKEYAEIYVRQEVPPLFRMIEIETINRCNGNCSFCPAGRDHETRPFMKMSEKTFEKIVSELAKINYDGEVLLEVNNEPLLDTRLVSWAEKLKKSVPACTTAVITNGSILTVEKFKELGRVIDRIVINNYSEKYALHENIRKIYLYAKSEKRSDGPYVEIRRRYVKEVLANRAGTAPNHKKAAFPVTMPCLYPFAGMTIFPDGKVGLCSNDCLEQTDFGNVQHQGLTEIWNGRKFRNARKQIAKGRKNYAFCSECDVIGLGTREQIAKKEKFVKKEKYYGR